MIKCDGDTMKENKIKIIIYLVLVTLFVGVGLVVLYLTNQPEDMDELHNPIVENYTFQEVYDINEYQMVYTSMNTYYNLRNNQQKNLLNLLLEKYKEQNHITIGVIDNFVEPEYENYNYTITDLTKYANSYYSIYLINGKYTLEGLDTIIEERMVKDILVLDAINNTYAILPIINNDYNKTFNDILKAYSLENYNQEIKKNENNEVQRLTMSEFNEANMYYNEYIHLLFSDCTAAYNLVGSETKKKYPTFDEFKMVCSFYTVSPSITKYSIENTEEGKTIDITDTYGHRYKFILESVKKYKIEIVK